ncbi:hypothetical protein [Lysobacter antibioticus]|nr:hypothetical protein [Lysobacter antibioticus]
MTKKWLHLHVKTATSSFWFEVLDDPANLDYWRSHGVEILEGCNAGPEFIVNAGLLKPWVFLQDIFNFKWPWSKA